MPELDMFWMGVALGRPEECSEEVTRAGILQPCDKTAIALRFDPQEPGQTYSVCALHARDEMVSLEQIVRFFLDRAETQRRAARGLVRLGTDRTMRAPWDSETGCFGHCDPEGWAECANRTAGLEER